MTIKERIAAEQKAARALIAKGEENLTDEEFAELKAHRDEYVKLSERAELFKGANEMLDAAAGDAKPATRAKSVGEHFAATCGERLQKAYRAGGKFSVVSSDFKAAGDTQVTGGTSGTFGDVLTTIDTQIVQAYRRPTVTSLFGTGSISGQAITYFVEGAREGGFATVAEGGAKPQFHYADPTKVTDALTKIAGVIKESDEMIEDLPFLVSEINQRLLYDLSIFEEQQLLSGDGTGSNLTGLLNRAIQTYAVASGGSDAEGLFHARTLIQNATGLNPDGIVINPADYERLRLSKDANGQYFGGGFFAGQYGNGADPLDPPLWGLSTVVSPAVAEGTAIVGAFKQAATVYRKGGVRVESTNSNEDDFTHNLIAIRAEERIAFAVRRPSAFVNVSLSSKPADSGKSSK